MTPIRGHNVSAGHAQGTSADVQTRIDQLESLVLDLMHANRAPSPYPPSRQEPRLASRAQLPHTPTSSESEHQILPSPSDHGSISVRRERVSYVGSSHWAAVLDSITELRNHFAQEEDAHDMTPSPPLSPLSFPRPRLLYNGLAYETPASIIKSMPPRSTVDRLVSRYFNVLDIAPGMPQNQNKNPRSFHVWSLAD